MAVLFFGKMSNEEIYNIVVRPNEQWQTRDNIYDLVDLARDVPSSGTVLDIGIGGAVSACAMSLASKPEVRVYSVGPDVSPIAIEKINKAECWGKVYFLVGTSDQVFQNWNKTIDLAFVDGEHQYEEVKRDAKNCSNFLNLGGFLVFHDYDLYKNTVGLAIDEFFEENKDKYSQILHHNNIIAFKKIA